MMHKPSVLMHTQTWTGCDPSSNCSLLDGRSTIALKNALLLIQTMNNAHIRLFYFLSINVLITDILTLQDMYKIQSMKHNIAY